MTVAVIVSEYLVQRKHLLINFVAYHEIAITYLVKQLNLHAGGGLENLV